jgi:hypothetical protein
MSAVPFVRHDGHWFMFFHLQTHLTKPIFDNRVFSLKTFYTGRYSPLLVSCRTLALFPKSEEGTISLRAWACSVKFTRYNRTEDIKRVESVGLYSVVYVILREGGGKTS